MVQILKIFDSTPVNIKRQVEEFLNSKEPPKYDLKLLTTKVYLNKSYTVKVCMVYQYDTEELV